LCGYLDPTRDGVADYTRRLAVHLRLAGLEPLVVSTYEWALAAGEGVVGIAERWDVRGVASAARALRRLDPDVLHVQFAPSVFGFARAVGLLPVFLPRRIPLVVTLHEYGVWCGHGRGRSVLWSVAERCGYADRETLLLVPRPLPAGVITGAAGRGASPLPPPLPGRVRSADRPERRGRDR
jgi:hypothetical protein